MCRGCHVFFRHYISVGSVTQHFLQVSLQNGQIKWLSISNTLSDTKICNLPLQQDHEHPGHFYVRVGGGGGVIFLCESPPPPPPHQVHDMFLRIIVIIVTLRLSFGAFPTSMATSNATGYLSWAYSSTLILACCSLLSSSFPSLLLIAARLVPPQVGAEVATSFSAL